jgi:hypothetical protein
MTTTAMPKQFPEELVWGSFIAGYQIHIAKNSFRYSRMVAAANSALRAGREGRESRLS